MDLAEIKKRIKSSDFMKLKAISIVNENRTQISSLISLLSFIKEQLKEFNNEKELKNDKNLDYLSYTDDEGFAYVDYNKDLGLRFNNFSMYDTKKVSCEERVILEALLIKYRTFGFKEFFCSFKSIEDELGIKKDKANSIIHKLIVLGLIKRIVRKSRNKNSGSPQQASFYKINRVQIRQVYPTLLKEDFQDLGKMYIEKYLQKVDTSYVKDNRIRYSKQDEDWN